MVSPSRPRRHPPRLAAIMLALAACGCEPAHTGPAMPPQAGRTVPVYCYRTLADVACYPAPDAGRERQLLGIYRRAALQP